MIAELGDLADVPPTSHVVESRTRCARMCPGRRCRSRGRSKTRPTPPRRIPRAKSGGLIDVELTAAQARAAIKSGELDAAEYFDFYRQRAAADAFNSYIWVAEETPELDTDTPFAGVPIAIKDLFCTEGVPSQAGSKILEGYRPPYTATSVRNLKAAGGTLLGKTNQDEFAMGSSTENSAFGPTLNPWERPGSPAARPAAARPASPPAPRRGRSAPTPAARSASPPRCAGSSGSSRPTARSAATG